MIVPIYNVEPYLDRCIASILEQTYTNLEVILVDDGSTDESGRICDRWSGRDDRILVLHRKNGGLADARNAGLDRAAGDYLVFVDGDDYIDPVLIRYCLDTLKKSRVDMVLFDYHRVNEADNGLAESEGRPHEKRVNQKRLSDLCLCTGKRSMAVWNKFYRRRIWEQLRFPAGRVAEDSFVLLDILMRVEHAVISDKKLYYYRRRTGSITNVGSRKFACDALESCRLRCIQSKRDRRLYRMARTAYAIQLMEVYRFASEKGRKKIVKVFRRAVKFPVGDASWKLEILLNLFYIHPRLYEWFFVEHRQQLRDVERMLHIKYEKLP